MNIYVSNLSYHLTDQDLHDVFAPFGEVVSAKIINDRENGRSKGFGFVEMADRAQGIEAIAQLNGKGLHGRDLKVNEARPRAPRGARQFGAR